MRHVEARRLHAKRLTRGITTFIPRSGGEHEKGTRKDWDINFPIFDNIGL